MTMARNLAVWLACLTVAGLMMAMALAGAARAQTATGDWHGALTVPTSDLRIGIEITAKPGGGFEGGMTSPDQSPRTVPLGDVRMAGGRLSFSLAEATASFDGAWDAASSAWVGQWSQGGAKLPLTLSKGKPMPNPTIVGLDGDWAGALPTATGGKLRLVLHIGTGTNGTVALIDSPDQMAFGMPLSGLERTGQAVRFQQKTITATYAGTLSADGKTLSGIFTQAGESAPLNFSWGATTRAAAKRPQTPVKPYPYREEEVAFDSAPGVRLAGSLTLPAGKGPFPVAVMITGSGAQDRDETLFDHKLFLVIADRLTRDGVAVLRTDDRGTAKSTGEFAKATSEDFAGDARAAVAYLRARPDIDPRRVGLIGHSEGGMIGPMVAALDPKIAFVVMLAGPGAPVHELMVGQRAAVARAMGAAPAAVAQNEALMSRVEAALAGVKDPEAATAVATKVLTEGGLPPTAVKAQAAMLSSPWFRWFIAYDPAPTLAKLRMPVLALDGDKDTQVVSSQNLPPIRAALKANPDATVMELPGLNHLFQTATTGGPGEYAQIEETISPAALTLISGWVVKHTAEGAAR
jgi:pimeloyl-ACP methyl ester carboxylesterase